MTWFEGYEQMVIRAGVKQLHGFGVVEGGRKGADDREFEVSGWNVQPGSNLVEMAISWKLDK
jgi:hypothetical protein